MDAEEKGDATTRNNLWKSMRPMLQSSHDHLFFHIDNSDDANANEQTLDLPKFSKYLLVAAYCASYNPAISDRRFFLKVRFRVVALARCLRCAGRVYASERKAYYSMY